MHVETIVVSSVEDGWAVVCDSFEVVIFSRGGQAEVAARRLAEAFARAGKSARVLVQDRRGSLAGAFFMSPDSRKCAKARSTAGS